MEEKKVVHTVNALREVTIRFNFYRRDQMESVCRRAGIRIHAQTPEEYEATRESQLADATQSGTDATRMGRTDRQGNKVYDPGQQIIAGENVSFRQFVADLESQGFKLVDVVVLQGWGKRVDNFEFMPTFAFDDQEDQERRPIELTPEQKKIYNWFLDRVYGRTFVWRNFDGEQLNIPALSIRQDKNVTPNHLRMQQGGRRLTLGGADIQVEFQHDSPKTTTTTV